MSREFIIYFKGAVYRLNDGGLKDENIFDFWYSRVQFMNKLGINADTVVVLTINYAD